MEKQHRRREEEITSRADANTFSSDEDAESLHPIFDSFFEAGGNAAITRMVNFTTVEFKTIYFALEERIRSHWNVGQGRKYSHTQMDVFFMTLSVLKYGGSWDFSAQMFRLLLN